MLEKARKNFREFFTWRARPNPGASPGFSSNFRIEARHSGLQELRGLRPETDKLLRENRGKLMNERPLRVVLHHRSSCGEQFRQGMAAVRLRRIDRGNPARPQTPGRTAFIDDLCDSAGKLRNFHDSAP
jgi:hypothetical protein